MPDVPESDQPTLIEQFAETAYDTFNDVADYFYGDTFNPDDYIVPDWEGEGGDWAPDDWEGEGGDW